MNKELEEFLQAKVISEDVKLSNMIQDIVPIKENRFTDIELATERKQEFQLVVYKKQNPIITFFKSIKFGFEKIRIAKHSRNLAYVKIENKN